MPEPDLSSIVINAKTGYAYSFSASFILVLMPDGLIFRHTRNNLSWILGRVLRDFDYWKPKAVGDRLREVLEEVNLKAAAKNPNSSPRTKAGLCVSIFHASFKYKSGVPVADWIYYSGIPVAIIQLGIASIPWATHGDWAVFVITGAGILLAFATGALPQWRAEKWGYPRVEKTVILTRGNGAQHALVIIGDKDTLDLEILANAEPQVTLFTQFCIIALAILWIVHLITVIGINEDPWFLMAIGGIGMMQNVMVAGLPRRPEALGLPLELETCIAHPKAMETLKEVETRYPGVGAAMVNTFFPGKLGEDEEKWWAAKAATNAI